MQHSKAEQLVKLHLDLQRGDRVRFLEFEGELTDIRSDGFVLFKPDNSNFSLTVEPVRLEKVCQ